MRRRIRGRVCASEVAAISRRPRSGRPIEPLMAIKRTTPGRLKPAVRASAAVRKPPIRTQLSGDEVLLAVLEARVHGHDLALVDLALDHAGREEAHLDRVVGVVVPEGAAAADDRERARAPRSSASCARDARRSRGCRRDRPRGRARRSRRGPAPSGSGSASTRSRTAQSTMSWSDFCHVASPYVQKYSSTTLVYRGSGTIAGLQFLGSWKRAKPEALVVAVDPRVLRHLRHVEHQVDADDRAELERLRRVDHLLRAASARARTRAGR